MKLIGCTGVTAGVPGTQLGWLNTDGTNATVRENISKNLLEKDFIIRIDEQKKFSRQFGVSITEVLVLEIKPLLAKIKTTR